MFTLIEVVIAVFVHDSFIRPYVGDVLVVVVVYCFVRIFLAPRRWLPVAVFVFAGGIEVAQLFDFVTRLGLQDNRILATMLGSTFDPVDLLCYFVGCALLFVWQEWCRKAGTYK